MQYAVVESCGKQFKVNVGQELLIDRQKVAVGKPFAFDRVLLIRDGGEIILGTPYVNNAQVLGKVISELKGDKVTTSKFKAKVNYRRKIGFRHSYSKILIESISLKGKKPSSKAAGKS